MPHLGENLSSFNVLLVQKIDKNSHEYAASGCAGGMDSKVTRDQ
jgi:hypothetical protein